MFNKKFKLVIVAVLIVFSVYQFYEGFIGNGIMYVFFSLFFLLIYFKNEFLILAFFQLRKQNMIGAEKWLNKIRNPKSALITKQQGYYNYMRGLIISQTNMNQAEKFFRNAIDLGLNMDHDLAMAKLNLSGILFTKRRKIEAQKLLKEAQELDKQGMLTEQIRMMKNQMKRGNMPNQHYNRGGFRRR